jgi:hypothetical protein
VTGVERTDEAAAAPSREDPLVGFLSESAGGVLGRHAGGRARSGAPWGASGALGVLPLLAVGTLAVAVLLRQHCRTTLWASPDQFTHACYSDVPALYASSGLDAGTLPYLEAAAGGQHLAQPVGTGFVLWLLSLVAPEGRTEVRWAFDLAVVLVAVALVALVLAVAALARHRPWDAALVALSPAVAATALVSLDLLFVALAVLGVLAFARGRPVAAGVLLGLAAAGRPLAAVVVVALWLLAARTGRWLAVGTVSGAAALTWAVVNVPVLVLAADGWRAYWQGQWAAPAGYGSLWLLPRLVSDEIGSGALPPLPGWVSFVGAGLVVVAGVTWALLPADVREDLRPGGPWVWVPLAAALVVLPPLLVRFGSGVLGRAAGLRMEGSLRWWVLGGTVLVVVAVGLFVLSAQRRPRLPVVVLLLLLGVLAVAPTVPVQAGLWVLPFAALAVPRWRDLLAWGAVEAAYATGTWLYLYGLSVENRGLPPWAYALLVVVRFAAAGWLAHRAVTLSRWPQDDVVRTGPGREDDPAAGELEDAPDALVVSFAGDR